MVLYCYILFVASIVSSGWAESASNQAVSSQRYERGDVPLSYKHNFIHIYTTPNPHLRSNHHPHIQYPNTILQPQASPQIENYRQIQYAPLTIQTAQSNREINIPATTNNNEDIEIPSEEQKTYLEPQIVPIVTPHTQPEVKYIPGFNVNIRSTNNNLYKNKKVNVNFQPNLINKSPVIQGPYNAEAAPVQMYPKNNAVYSVLTNQYAQDGSKYNGYASSKVNNVQPNVYVKAPTVALNVAHGHNIAIPYPKASVIFSKFPSLPQEYFNSHAIQPNKSPINQKRYVYGQETV